MIKKTKKLLVVSMSIICVLALLGLVIFFSGDNIGTNNKETIKIGAVLPLTGEAGAYGQYAQEGINLAVDKIESETGLDLEIIYEDSQMDPNKAVNAVQKLINIDEVDYVVGTLSSGEALAMCPVTESNKVLLLTTGSSPDIATKCGEYTFSDFPSDIYSGKVLADKVYGEGYNNVAVFYVNNDYGVGAKNEFVKNFKGKIVIMESHMPGDSDFRTQLAKIKDKNPDAIVLISHPTEGKNILKRKTELKIDQPIFAAEGLKDIGLYDDVSDDVTKNVFVVSPSQYEGAEYLEYKNAYFQKYSKDIGAFSDYMYDNVLVLGYALEGCSETDCVKEKISNTNMIGATGIIQYDSSGGVIGKPYGLYKIENGEFMLVD